MLRRCDWPRSTVDAKLVKYRDDFYFNRNHFFKTLRLNLCLSKVASHAQRKALDLTRVTEPELLCCRSGRFAGPGWTLDDKLFYMELANDSLTQDPACNTDMINLYTLHPNVSMKVNLILFYCHQSDLS